MDVVQRDARHHRVEGALGGEVLEPDSVEDRAFRSLGVDRDDIEASFGEGARKLPLAAADLEHASRWLGQVRAREIEEQVGAQGHGRRSSSSKPSSVARTRAPIVSST